MTLSLWIVAAVAVFLIAFDIAVAVVRGQQATISVSLYEFAKRYPVVPFAIGFLMGHFFWPVQTTVQQVSYTIPLRVAEKCVRLFASSGYYRVPGDKVPTCTVTGVLE